MENHKNILYSLVVVLLILQIISFTTLSSQVSKLHTQLDESNTAQTQARKEVVDQFTSLLDVYTNENKKSILTLSQTITEQKDTFDEQLSSIKSSQNDFSDIIKESLKGVVGVRTDRSIATGFIITSNGYIVTNHHVISGASQIGVLTNEQKILPAVLVGSDAFRDIALLKVEGNFEELVLADSDDLQVGRKVIAIGNPLGLSFSVSEGIISGLNRAGPNNLEEYIQVDVPLNPGNSGGPLIDISGQVVGINNFKVGDSEGLGFALESNSIKLTINRISNSTIL